MGWPSGWDGETRNAYRTLMEKRSFETPRNKRMDKMKFRKTENRRWVK